MILGAAKKHEFSEKLSILVELDTDITFDGRRNTLISSSPVSIAPHFGTELQYIKKLFFRMGMGQIQQITDISGNGQNYIFRPNMGIGVKLNNLSIDYALTDIGDFAAGLYSNVFSLKLGINHK